MKLANWTAVLTVATLALAPVAHAADARLADCISMAKQVSAALDSAQTSTTTDEAKTQAAAGRSYCASQMYAQGVAHYSRALQLLGKG
jgi:hypothetical protein